MYKLEEMMGRSPQRTRERPLRTTRSGGRAVPVRRNRGRIWALAGAAVVALIGIGAFLALRNQPGDLAGVQTYGNIERGHTEEAVSYPQTPPVGGPHNPQWQNCGIYDQPVGNTNVVHSLEHGAVWITYRPDLPAPQVEELRVLARGRSHALVSPYPNLPAPIVASAWGVQMKADDAGDARLARFVNKYEQGSQTPEPGATCRGGVGSPKGG